NWRPQRPRGVHQGPHPPQRKSAEAHRFATGVRRARLGVHVRARTDRVPLGPPVPELPEVQAHAERLTAQFSGVELAKFVPLTFTALKTALPRPDAAYGLPLETVGRRGKYLLLRFEPVTFVVHLMQGGRLLVDEKQSAKPRNGQARFVFADAPALLLTEAGTERRAGVWCIANSELGGPPLDRLGPEALDVTPQSLTESFAKSNMRIHGYLRDQ